MTVELSHANKQTLINSERGTYIKLLVELLKRYVAVYIVFFSCICRLWFDWHYDILYHIWRVLYLTIPQRIIKPRLKLGSISDLF